MNKSRPEGSDVTRWLRSRCLGDGYLPAETEGLSDAGLASLLDYEDGSTMEACAERLPKMMVWSSEATAEEIAQWIVR